MAEVANYDCYWGLSRLGNWEFRRRVSVQREEDKI